MLHLVLLTFQNEDDLGFKTGEIKEIDPLLYNSPLCI